MHIIINKEVFDHYYEDGMASNLNDYSSLHILLEGGERCILMIA